MGRVPRMSFQLPPKETNRGALECSSHSQRLEGGRFVFPIGRLDNNNRLCVFSSLVVVSVGAFVDSRFAAVDKLHVGKRKMADFAVKLALPLAVNRHLCHLNDVANL